MAQAELSAVIQELSDNFVVNCVSFAALALLIFDTLLTLPFEIREIWCKAVKMGTILYLFARYLSMVLFLAVIYVRLFNISLMDCNIITRLAGTLQVLCLIGVQGLLLARTYAISFQARRVLGILGLLILGAVITEVYKSILFRCNIPGPLATWNLWDIFQIVTVILYDTGVVIVTILSSIQTLRLWKGEIWNKKSLLSLVIYQGFIRYGFVLTITFATSITGKTLRPSLDGFLNPLQNSLSIIVVCRFHLTLKERHSQLNSHSVPTLSLTSFKAARQSVHDAIVAEFGNPCLRRDFNVETLEDDVAHRESQQSPDEAGSAGIELDEFPGATGCPRDI